MSDNKDLEFLAAKSKDLIDKQVASYRQKHTNASSIIAVIAIFIPLFLTGLDDSYLQLKFLSVIPIVLLLYSIILLLFNILRSKPLDQALGFNKFQDLINEHDYEKLLLYEIGANKSSFEDNTKITEIANRKYNLAIGLTTAAIIVSVILLTVNKFYKPEKPVKPVKVEVLDARPVRDSARMDSSARKRLIPIVPEKERTRLKDERANFIDTTTTPK